MISQATTPRTIFAAVLIAALLVGGLAYNVLHSQSSARSGLQRELARRSVLAANLTISALTSSTPPQMKASFGGPPSGLKAAMREFESFDPDPRAAILDARGRPLVTWPIGTSVSDLVRDPVAQRALRGEFAISDLELGDDDKSHMILLGVPFNASSGRRVGLEIVSATIIDRFASSYLASAPAIRGGHSFLIDGHQRVLASSASVSQGRPLPDRGLAASLRRGMSGSYRDRYFASAPLEGTNWRVVLSVSRDELFASVQGATGRAAWLAFAAFVAALLALVGVGLSALRKSAQLVTSRERERAAQRAAHERLHDALTGLPNRTLFLDRTEQALALASRTGRTLAVLFIDIDRFQRVNDSLGHRSGDELLKMLGARLAQALRPGDAVSRFGGDQFIVLCAEVEGIEETMQVATDILTALDEPFDLDGRSVHISCCIGVGLHMVQFPAQSAETLVRDANVGLNRAKAHGAGSLRVFDSDLHGDALERLDTEVALRAGISGGELRVHYQPIVGLPDGHVGGVEALVRWQRPGIGLVAPLAFIGLAEECALIEELGQWVLQTAMENVAQWHDRGLAGPDFVLSVNVSMHQLAGEGLPALVEELLARWPLQPSQLWLEITESTVANDPQLAQRQISALSALGIRIAIDDFGTGQSSLEQVVHSMPVDILKLDRSFTLHLGDDREHAVAAAIETMARAMRMTAVAEGVETADQASELYALGYLFAQGYHFGRPMDAAAMRDLLAGAAMVGD